MVKERIKQTAAYLKWKRFIGRYERLLVPGVLLFGVLADFITFRTISIRSAFLLLTAHVMLVGTAIAFMHFYDDERVRVNRLTRYFRLFVPYIIQFSLGALLSASLVFYWFSGSLSVSWPILIIIALLMASNEVFREYYLKPVVQLSVYFFAVFSFFTLILPFLFNSIDTWVFVFAGILALLFIGLYLRLLSKSLLHIHVAQGRVLAGVFGIYLVMNTLYLLNVIPPIPLSIRDAGVYHSVERISSGYLVKAEQVSLLDRILPGQTVHIQPGNPVYVFTSIFAPADLDTTIVHHWRYYDEENRGWESSSKLSFSIFGGREEGYRGYSLKRRLTPGLWRVDVETPSGQILGVIRFRVEYTEESVELIQIEK